MKKFIATILLIIICCFMLAACEEVPDRVAPVETDAARFQYLGQDDVNANGNGDAGDVVLYYLDNKTNIVYVLILNRAGNGTHAGFTPLIDTDGSYTTYEEFKKN